ncbi:MAG: MBL fold metallo-hydrolase [Clostridia bacterium]|nr:MBL fold metallo-hydrolase [Clostridia bacterium]
MKKRWILFVTLMLILLTACAGAQELRVDFYDMGKADAMLITTPSGKRILIDTGTNKGGKALVSRFEKEDIETIDVMIITHYDKDSKQHDQFVEALDESGAASNPMKIGSQTAFDTGDGVSVHITAAHQNFYGRDEENDFSLAVRLTYGDTKFLFAGDAEDPRQRELLEEGDVSCDVLKVPYHGRLVNASERFLKAASPKIAFIPDSAEDPASPVVIGILEEIGAKVYRAKDGSIAVVSDGKDVKVL